MSRRRFVLIAIFVIFALLVVARRPIVKLVLEQALGLATGYAVSFGNVQLGWSHAVLTDVHVRSHGDPLLDARRIDVDYALRDLFPGGHHRYGFAAIAVQYPTLTLVRHRDGSYNVGARGVAAQPSTATKRAATPLLFTARVRNGTILLVDEAPLQRDLQLQSVVDVAIDVSFASETRTTARMDGTWIGRRAQRAPDERWPIHVRSTIDDDRGFAIHRLRAAALPIRGALDFIVHAPVARFDDGVLRDVDIMAYAVDVARDTPIDYRLGGGARLEDGRLAVGPLVRPIRNLRGRIALYENGVTLPGLEGSLAGIPLRADGGLYDFASPRLRLGVSANADLALLRTAFAFTRDKPIAGTAHLETLIAGPADDPMIRTVLSAPLLFYDRVPVTGATAQIDYLKNEISVAAARGRYAAFQTALDGDVQLGQNATAMRFFLRARGPADAVPYAQNIAAGQTIDARTIVAGTAEGGFRVGGTVASAGPGGSGEGFLAIDQYGVGEFGPFAFRANDGSSLVGSLRLERPISSSAGWIFAERYRLVGVARPAVLPGLALTGFPPLSGRLDAALIGGGSPDAFGLAGRLHVAGLRFGSYDLGTADARIGGSFTDMRLREIALDGPIGRFRGDGAFAADTLALDGRYEGSFRRLEPFTGALGASGAIGAPVALLIDPSGILVQTTGASLRGGSVRGVPLDRAAGTLAIAGDAVRVVAADAVLAGARLVAAAHTAREVAVSAVDLPARALRNAGFPLDRGRMSLFGLVDLQGPRFRGTVDLADGLTRGYAVHGWADLAFAGTTLSVAEGVGAIGSTYGRIGGRIEDVGGAAPRYVLSGAVPLGDDAALIRDLRLPLPAVAGSYSAQLTIEGQGTIPRIRGMLSAPEGIYHGVAFRDGSTLFAVTPPSVSIENGRLTVGSTTTRLVGALAPNRLELHASSTAADLADFDGYFYESEALAGRGSFDVALAGNGRTLTSTGSVALSDVRFQRFPLGAVNARWRNDRGAIALDGSLGGTGGTLEANGTIVPGAGNPLDAFRRARYDLRLAGTRIDLGTWLPAAGIRQPLLGRVDATGRVAGVFPRLTGSGDVSLQDGFVGPYPVRGATARAQITGDRVQLESAAADLGFASFTAGGSFGMAPDGAVNLRVHSSVPDTNEALRRLFPRRPIPLFGALDVDTVFGGTRSAPRLTAGIDFENGRYATLAIPRIIANGESDLRSIQLNSAEIDLPRGRAIVAGTLPITLNPPGIGPPNAPLSLSLEANGIDLASFAGFLPGEGVQLGGVVDGQLALEGTVRSPRVLGTTTLRNGLFVSKFESSPIRNVDASARFNGTTVTLQEMHADVGRGTLDASGELNLPIPGAPSSGFSIGVVARGAELNFPAYGGGRIDGNAQIVSGPVRPTLSGDLTLNDARIPFAAITHAASSGEPADASAPALDLGFDLRARVGRNVRIRSPIIDVGTTGQLTLIGTLRAPRLAGTLNATPGGIFSTYARAFRIEQATVSFDPSQGIVPTIDLRAVTHVTNPDPDPDRNAIGSANIIVTVTGPADHFTTAFSSEPPYPQAQIIGLLIDAPLLGAVNFNNAPHNAGLLPGAPGESNVLLPPGVTPYQTGSYTLQQEAYSLLNAQVTQRFLAPVERFFVGALGLDDLNLTVDFGGRLGYTMRRVISTRSNLAATFSQILSYPTRTQLGFDMRPDATTTASFTYFEQSAAPAFVFGNASDSFNGGILTGVQPLSNRQGFRFSVVRRYP